MNFSVTGANGHVGNDSCRALVERGYRVRAALEAACFYATAKGVQVVFYVAAAYALHEGRREKRHKSFTRLRF